ncbi:hypothetical protein CLCAR_4236 [Clostridium carboxidivorans P7]|nr:hypothetical protein CLCAR_4236 [Clostridium carboxidivorans P7]
MKDIDIDAAGTAVIVAIHTLDVTHIISAIHITHVAAAGKYIACICYTFKFKNITAFRICSYIFLYFNII